MPSDCWHGFCSPERQYGIVVESQADADLRFSLQYCQVTRGALFLVRVLREPLIYLSSCEV